MNQRVNYLVSQELETELTLKLVERLYNEGFNASNTVIITVSTDYSSNVGQLLRHQLSHNGEICDGFAIDVPYPDQTWDSSFVYELQELFNLYSYKLKGKKILLVEAGVIRGSNYTFLKNYLGTKKDLYFLSLFENIGSIFKSDYVGKYYDDTTQDLTFWWEEFNNHWK